MKSHQRRAGKPLRYYENLRMSGMEHRSRPESQVVEVKDEETGEDIRLMHILTLMSTPPISAFIYHESAALLALKHFNARSNMVIDDLSDRLGECNIYLTMDMLSADFDAVVATTKLYSYFSSPPTLTSPQPVAVVGATVSRISRALAILTGAYQIPQISPASQAVELDRDDIAPTFSRTVPTVKGIAQTMVDYFKEIGATHFHALVGNTDFSSELLREFLEATSESKNLTVISVGYDLFVPGSLDRALKKIKDSGVRYIFATVTSMNHRDIFEEAYDAGLIGAEYAWFIPDVINAAPLSLNRKSDEKFISALQGLSQIGFWTRPHATFETELKTLQSDNDYQSFYVEAHGEEGRIFESAVNITELTPLISFYAYYTYDAVMALGIAACNVQDDDILFTGAALNQELRRTTFNGVTGPVELDPNTGTRKWETVKYGLGNFFVDEIRSDDDTAFVQERTALVFERNTETLFRELHPLIFADGTTTPPVPLVELEQDLNLISTGVYAFGWVLAGGMMLSCLLLIAWVSQHHKDQRVAAAQPRFLILILVGTLLMAASVIPQTFQEPTSQEGLDAACMSVPWLLFTGFSIAFGAIFTKTRRLSLVIQGSVAMQRSHLKTWYVMLPFTIIVSFNVLVLLLWTVISPSKWVRTESSINFDVFGRSVESFGGCQGMFKEEDQASPAILFSALLIGFDVLVVVVGLVQAYSMRHVPALFNDAPQMALSAACLLEAFILSIPVLLLVSENPTASFVTWVLVTTALCLALLLPHFGSRLSGRNKLSLGRMQAEWRSFLTRRTKEPASKRWIVQPQSSQTAETPALTGEIAQPPLSPRNPPGGGQFSLRAPELKDKNASQYRRAALLRGVLASEEEKRSEQERPGNSAELISTVAEIRRRASQRLITPPLHVTPEAPQEVTFAENIR